jgi:hypothetical protein
MQTITLTNSFHNTSATVRPVPITEGRFAGLHKISRKTALRLRRELCGSTDCTSGGNFGERGGAHLAVINEDYDRNYIVDLKASN